MKRCQTVLGKRLKLLNVYDNRFSEISRCLLIQKGQFIKQYSYAYSPIWFGDLGGLV